MKMNKTLALLLVSITLPMIGGFSNISNQSLMIETKAEEVDLQYSLGVDGLYVMPDVSYASLESLIIPENALYLGNYHPVVGIDDNAFKNCTLLKEVDLGFIHTIGQNAFMGASSIKKVVIPSSVKEIKAEAFKMMGSLVEVIINSDENIIIGEKAFSSNANLLYIYYFLDELPLNIANNYLLGSLSATELTSYEFSEYESKLNNLLIPATIIDSLYKFVDVTLTLPNCVDYEFEEDKNIVAQKKVKDYLDAMDNNYNALSNSEKEWCKYLVISGGVEETTTLYEKYEQLAACFADYLTLPPLSDISSLVMYAFMGAGAFLIILGIIFIVVEKRRKDKVKQENSN